MIATHLPAGKVYSRVPPVISEPLTAAGFTGRNGVTIIELMFVILILSILLSGVYRVFFQGQRQALEIMDSHVVNDDVQRLVDRLTDDIREANYVDDNVPPVVAMGAESSLKSDDANNWLFFTKLQFDFTKDPNLPNQKIYTQQKVVYYLEGPKNVRGKDGPPWALIREMTPWDDHGVVQTTKKEKVTIMEDIDELIFYRLNNPASSVDSPGTNNVFIRIVMKRLDPKIPDSHKYRSEIVTSIRLRGSDLEGEVKAP
ncbi:MAG: prepilin-type N-terminal cleavage/methylation domain-containing protein [Candidatus Riflebacteria bacterium]|nr:prepilin-type N-terminal cleavage/methylation domain-containing protein [Candidatus Riflebacteria bacterium]